MIYFKNSNGILGHYGEYTNLDTPGSFYKAKLLITVVGGEGYRVTLRDGTVYNFYADGSLYEIIYRNGQKLTIIGGSSLPSRILSTSGRSIDLFYDAFGLITQIKDNTGRTFNYTYNSSLLMSVTDPNGKVRRYTYDTNRRMLTVTDPNGNVMIANEYDTLGRVSKQTYADGTTHRFVYTVDTAGKITQTDVIDQRGNIRRSEFDSYGQVAKDTYPVGTPEQRIYQFTRDPVTNLMQSVTDPLGRVTSYTYDSFGNQTGVTRMAGTPEAVTTTYTYEPTYNQLASVTDALGRTITIIRDSNGNATAISNALGETFTLAYNLNGQVTGVTDPLGHTTSYTYTGTDLVGITDPLNRAVQLFTDAAGRTAQVTDPLGNTSLTQYDVLNRVTQQIDGLGNAVQYAYDNNGNLASHTDPRGNITNYAYNTLGKLTTRTDALNQAELTSYDIMGKVQTHTDRKGQVSGVTYDTLSRATRIGFGATPASPTTYTDTLDLTYDAVDRVTRIVDSKAGTITRQYDNFNRLTQETSPQGAVTYSYDLVGRRITLTVTGQATINYSYDNADRLTAIAQGSQSVTFSYDAAGRRTQTTLANGLQVNYTYDVANQLTGIEYKKGASVIGTLTYSYDKAGRRTAMGGSLTKVDLPAAIATAIYDANNRLTNWNGQTFQYDLNGNLINDGPKTYQWDSRNQLQQISGSSSALFNYDAFGRRTQKTINGTNTSFLFDGDNFVQETKAGIKTNLLTGMSLDEVYNRGSQALLTDALGSIIGLTDAAGNLTTTYSYTPYGETTQTGTASTNSQQYTGRENDGTGLYYYRNRYYMPTCGRFISEDPIGIAGGVNLYQYVGGDPISLIDPMGLKAYTACETARIMSDARNQNLWEAFINHGGSGKYDFREHQPFDTFNFGGINMNAGQFGNFLAGYSGAYNGWMLGYVGVIVGGMAYDINENGWSFNPDAHDRPIINAGAVLGVAAHMGGGGGGGQCK